MTDEHFGGKLYFFSNKNTEIEILTLQKHVMMKKMVELGRNRRIDPAEEKIDVPN